jgi:hypothetical protein
MPRDGSVGMDLVQIRVQVVDPEPLHIASPAHHRLNGKSQCNAMVC